MEFCLLFFFFFDTGSHYVAQAGMKLSKPRLGSNSWQPSFLSLPSAKSTGVSHHAWQRWNIQRAKWRIGRTRTRMHTHIQHTHTAEKEKRRRAAPAHTPVRKVPLALPPSEALCSAPRQAPGNCRALGGTTSEVQLGSIWRPEPTGSLLSQAPPAGERAQESSSSPFPSSLYLGFSLSWKNGSPVLIT